MRSIHVALAFVVVVVWGVNFVVIDIGLRHYPPLLLAALRFAFVAIPGIFLVKRPPVAWKWIVLVGLFLGVGYFGLVFLGMYLGMPAGLSSLVLQAQAMFTLILAAVFLGERLNRVRVIGTALATAGLAVIGWGTTGSVPFGAFMLVLGAAASWAVSNILTRKSQAPAGLGLLIWSSIIPPIPLAALSVLIEGPQTVAHAITTFEAGPLLSLAYLVLVATLFGFGAWNALLRMYPANVVAPYSLLVPVVGIASAWLLLDEQPGRTEMIGAGVVLLGLVLVVRQVRRPEAIEVKELPKEVRAG